MPCNFKWGEYVNEKTLLPTKNVAFYFLWKIMTKYSMSKLESLCGDWNVSWVPTPDSLDTMYLSCEECLIRLYYYSKKYDLDFENPIWNDKSFLAIVTSQRIDEFLKEQTFLIGDSWKFVSQPNINIPNEFKVWKQYAKCKVLAEICSKIDNNKPKWIVFPEKF